MKIKCNNESPAAKETIKFAYKKWIASEERYWYTRRDHLGLHLKLIHSELHKKENYFFFQYMDRGIREEVDERIHTHHVSQLKKLEHLTSIYNTTTNQKNPKEKREDSFNFILE